MQDDINKPVPDNSPGQGTSAEPAAATTASQHAAAAAAPSPDKSAGMVEVENFKYHILDPGSIELF